jgi:hypothetical protein
MPALPHERYETGHTFTMATSSAPRPPILDAETQRRVLDNPTDLRSLRTSRGLVLAGALALDVGWYVTTNTKHVWARFPAPTADGV